MKKDFKAKVVGKWIKGIIWKRPMIGVRFMEGFDSQCMDIRLRTMANYYELKVGDIVSVSMELAEDDLWYPVHS